MTQKTAIHEVTAENFPVLVNENSRKGLVVVNFGTPTTAPCRLTLERLSSLAADFGNRFLLVHAHTDVHTELARQRDVQSVSTTPVVPCR